MNKTNCTQKNNIILTKMTRQALSLAYLKHNGQVDKAGLPYIFHPYTVALNMNDEISTTIALLHDIVEDTNTTFDELKQMFPKEVIDALSLLTHDITIPYFDYITKIKKNKYAKMVKLADLKHNSDLTRLTTITDEDIKRVEKYKKAIEMLEN